MMDKPAVTGSKLLPKATVAGLALVVLFSGLISRDRHSGVKNVKLAQSGSFSTTARPVKSPGTITHEAAARPVISNSSKPRGSQQLCIYAGMPSLVDGRVVAPTQCCRAKLIRNGIPVTESDVGGKSANRYNADRWQCSVDVLSESKDASRRAQNYDRQRGTFDGTGRWYTDRIGPFTTTGGGHREWQPASRFLFKPEPHNYLYV